jgi:hypothetical protein
MPLKFWVWENQRRDREDRPRHQPCRTTQQGGLLAPPREAPRVHRQEDPLHLPAAESPAQRR